jgi:hypothetical protein
MTPIQFFAYLFAFDVGVFILGIFAVALWIIVAYFRGLAKGVK